METKTPASASQTPADKQNLITRPPIVVVMGHIDHGKTTLLDKIREAHVAEKEAGGITQHIGAYEAEFQGKKITFIDTPGHEAFSAMRSRGAKVADIAILVIDACEGIQPQTKEVIFLVKKLGILFIVALNKTDKPQADPEKVKRELAQNDILVESMGGKVPSIEISAKTGKRIPELLELILLVAEMEELKGNTAQTGEGVVVEAYLDSKRGPTATLLLRNGGLKKGDIVGTRSTSGKIKILENFQGKPTEEALPSMPVVVLGLEKVPGVGEKFEVFPDGAAAQSYIEKKERKAEGGEVFVIGPDKKVLNIILKTDVLGSIEALEQVIKGLPQEKVVVRILKSGVGEINESDIKLAKSSRARIFGFRVKTNSTALKSAEQQNIKIMTFDVIYDLAQAVRQMMEKIIKPEWVRIDLGKMKTLIIFWTEKNRQIVGGKMIEGEIKKGASIEVHRNEEIIGKGRMINLQKDKKDIEKAKKGEEVGILYEGNARIEVGDILAIFQEEKMKSEL